MAEPVIRAFFDEPTNTVSYIVADPETKRAAFIDPVLDYNHNSGSVDTRSVEAMLKAADEAGLTTIWTLETHAHADHLSGSPYVKARPARRSGSASISRTFRRSPPVFNATDLKTDGSDFDHLFVDGETFRIGNLSVEVMYTPGHTPADILLRIGEHVFVGDTLFMPDLAPHGGLPPAVTYARSTARSARCWPCRRKRCCTCATTTRRQDAMRMPGRRRSASSVTATST